MHQAESSADVHRICPIRWRDSDRDQVLMKSLTDFNGTVRVYNLLF